MDSQSDCQKFNIQCLVYNKKFFLTLGSTIISTFSPLENSVDFTCVSSSSRVVAAQRLNSSNSAKNWHTRWSLVSSPLRRGESSEHSLSQRMLTRSSLARTASLFGFERIGLVRRRSPDWRMDLYVSSLASFSFFRSC